jgi:signal transduction histidine kinase
MARAFRQLELEPPAELQAAEQQWEREQGEAPLSSPVPDRSDARSETGVLTRWIRAMEDRPAAGAENDDKDDPDKAIIGEDQGQDDDDEDDHEREERYDARLSSIYVLTVDAEGRTVMVPGVIPPPYALDARAVESARNLGSDWRSVRLPGGERLRLLTYRIDSSVGPFFIQTGRSLSDQDQLRNQYLAGLLGLSLLATALLGLGSWWLSGQSLVPAQRSWDQQQTFIANASHELRTPLTLMKASAEVIRDTQPPPDEQAELVLGILSEIDYMDRLIGDLLLLSRLDTQRLDLSREPVELSELLNTTARQAERLAGADGPRLELGPAGGRVLADPQRLRQVLLILLDNAVRHTPPGGVVRLEAAAGSSMCSITIRDSGSGIAPEHLPHVFDRFYQVNPSEAGASRTNGLGLSIAKSIVEALHGRISIASQVGNGATVVIDLPAAP